MNKIVCQKAAPVYLLGIAMVAFSLAIAYASTLVDLWKDWQGDANYSVGQLVPLVALYLIWNQRNVFRNLEIKPCRWGLAVIVAAQGLRMYGLACLQESFQRYAFVLTVAGLVLYLAGLEYLKHLKWILLFLLLMVPLPGRLHNQISGPLQTLATSGAVFLLELGGINVEREGNTIVLNGSIPLAIAEACSGLRMLAAFIVVAALFAFLVSRPAWQKTLLVLSSVPVAIGCNLIRLFITACLFLHVSSKAAERFFHDFAGLTMMPLAVLILVGQLILIDKIAGTAGKQSP